jgi:glycosyltransferase involved in cell wall biosynthesis
VALSSAIKKTIERVSSDATIAIIPSAFTQTPLNENKVKKIKSKFSQKFLVGHIGALDDKHKGQSIIIELAKRVEKDYPQIHFLLVGGGKDEAMLKDMAKELTNVTFEGFVTNVNDYIASLDLFIFPSRNEGLGSILLDVMNHNIPIVASNVGGIIDIIENNVNGILFDIANIPVLEKIVISLYKNPQERVRLAKNAQNKISNYSVEKMTQSYINIYEI